MVKYMKKHKSRKFFAFIPIPFWSRSLGIRIKSIGFEDKWVFMGTGIFSIQFHI